jgi:hypothetical protein
MTRKRWKGYFFLGARLDLIRKVSRKYKGITTIGILAVCFVFCVILLFTFFILDVSIFRPCYKVISCPYNRVLVHDVCLFYCPQIRIRGFVV